MQRNYSISSELLSFCSPWRRLSSDTMTTRASEEDEDINKVDENMDGDGGVAQAICTVYT